MSEATPMEAHNDEPDCSLESIHDMSRDRILDKCRRRNATDLLRYSRSMSDHEPKMICTSSREASNHITHPETVLPSSLSQDPRTQRIRGGRSPARSSQRRHPICSALIPELLSSLGALRSSLECVVCLDLCRAAVELECCGIVGCENCFSRIRQCPHCRSQIIHPLRHALALRRVVDTLRVRCGQCGAARLRSSAPPRVESPPTTPDATLQRGCPPSTDLTPPSAVTTPRLPYIGAPTWAVDWHDGPLIASPYPSTRWEFGTSGHQPERVTTAPLTQHGTPPLCKTSRHHPAARAASPSRRLSTASSGNGTTPEIHSCPYCTAPVCARSLAGHVRDDCARAVVCCIACGPVARHHTCWVELLRQWGGTAGVGGLVVGVVAVVEFVFLFALLAAWSVREGLV